MTVTGDPHLAEIRVERSEHCVAGRARNADVTLLEGASRLFRCERSLQWWLEVSPGVGSQWLEHVLPPSRIYHSGREMIRFCIMMALVLAFAGCSVSKD